MYLPGSSGITILESIFEGNEAHNGGAIINYCDNVVIAECHFIDNYSSYDGGAAIFAGASKRSHCSNLIILY